MARAVSEQLSVVVCSRYPEVELTVCNALKTLGVMHRVSSPAFDWDGPVCVGAELLEGRRPLPRPTVVVCASRAVDDRTLAVASESGAVPIRLAQLGPSTLLGALIRAQWGLRPTDLTVRIAGLPHQVALGFLRWPPNCRGLHDVCRLLGVSPDRARQVVRLTGYQRAEHLFTRCRAEAWTLLTETGVRPGALTRYLGIRRYANFVRACDRAAVQPPWRRRDIREVRLEQESHVRSLAGEHESVDE